MSTVSDSPTGGQHSDESHSVKVGSEFIELLDKHTRAIVRLTAALTAISARLTKVERQLGMAAQPADDQDEDEDTAVDSEPLREPSDDADVVPFALGIDGRAIVEINYFDNEDVIDRKGWTGIVLDETETAELLTFLGDGASDAAARFGGHLRATRKKATASNDSGEQGGA